MRVSKGGQYPQSSQEITLSQAFDYSSDDKWAMRFENLAFTHAQRDQWGESLLIGALFCGKEKRNLIFREFIDRAINKSSPLYVLMKIAIGGYDSTLQSLLV